MDKTIEELKQEATELGIKFNDRIGAAKLAEKIEDFYTSQETSGVTVVDEDDQTEEVTKEKPAVKGIRAVAAAQKAAMSKTRIVTVVDNDQRVNNHTTTFTVNCGNEYFDLGQLVLPLNVPVEMTVGHIQALREVEIPQHVRDDKTGLSKVVMRKRYAVNTEDIEK